MSFVASWPGSCESCLEPITPGQECRYSPRGFVHVDCEAREPAQQAICCRCNLAGRLVGGLCPDCRLEARPMTEPWVEPTPDPFYDRLGFWEKVNRFGCSTCDGGGCPDCCDHVR